MPKTILSLCDYSGVWSDPYRRAGYDVLQIDIKHGQDCRLLRVQEADIYGILAAPVCTAFSAAGARHWKEKEAAGDEQLLEGLSIVDAVLRLVAVHQPTFWVMENPVGRLKDFIGNHAMTFQPSDFGGYLSDPTEDAYTKRTCLWGDFNHPTPKPVEPIHGSKMWSKYGGKSEKTKTARSMTPRGFARAFFEANP
jgi:hypothetical protein